MKRTWVVMFLVASACSLGPTIIGGTADGSGSGGASEDDGDDATTFSDGSPTTTGDTATGSTAHDVPPECTDDCAPAIPWCTAVVDRIDGIEVDRDGHVWVVLVDPEGAAVLQQVDEASGTFAPPTVLAEAAITDDARLVRFATGDDGTFALVFPDVVDGYTVQLRGTDPSEVLWSVVAPAGGVGHEPKDVVVRSEGEVLVGGAIVPTDVGSWGVFVEAFADGEPGFMRSEAVGDYVDDVRVLPTAGMVRLWSQYHEAPDVTPQQRLIELTADGAGVVAAHDFAVPHIVVMPIVEDGDGWLAFQGASQEASIYHLDAELDVERIDVESASGDDVLLPIRIAIRNGLPITFVDVGPDDDRRLEIHMHDESGAVTDAVALPDVGVAPLLAHGVTDLVQTDDALYFVLDIVTDTGGHDFVCRFDPS